MNVPDNEIKDLLLKYKNICVYGLSPDPHKASHYVPVYMRDHGWSIPAATYPQPHQVGGFQVYSSLAEVPLHDRKFLNVFRASQRIPEVFEEIKSVGGVEVLWLQLGISHPETEKRAEDLGLKVVSNRCLIIEHKRFFS